MLYILQNNETMLRRIINKEKGSIIDKIIIKISSNSSRGCGIVDKPINPSKFNEISIKIIVDKES
jgi:hypothetical protein